MVEPCGSSLENLPADIVAAKIVTPVVAVIVYKYGDATLHSYLTC